MFTKLLEEINSNKEERTRGVITISVILALLENLLESNSDKVLLLQTLIEEFEEKE